LEALRMLVDRREELARQRTQTANRLQRLLGELSPGKAKKDITTGQAKTSSPVLVAPVRGGIATSGARPAKCRTSPANPWSRAAASG